MSGSHCGKMSHPCCKIPRSHCCKIPQRQRNFITSDAQLSPAKWHNVSLQNGTVPPCNVVNALTPQNGCGSIDPSLEVDFSVFTCV